MTRPPHRVLLGVLLFAALAALLVVLAQFEEGAAATEERSEPALASKPTLAAPSIEAPSTASVADERRRLLETSTPSEGPWRIRGRTLLGLDRPMGGVAVELTVFNGPLAEGETLAEGRAVSDDEGWFEWGIAVPDRTVMIQVKPDHPGHSGYGDHARAVLGLEPPQDLEIRVYPVDFEIAGVVRTTEGGPIEGATVAYARTEVMTDADGRYSILVPGLRDSSLLVAWAEGRAHQRRDVAQNADGLAEVDFELAPEFRIHGRVFGPDEEPVAGASVISFSRGSRAGVETDAEGRYLLEHLDPGREQHLFSVRKVGFVETPVRVSTVVGGSVEQDVHLTRGARVAGRVVTQEGEAVAAAELYIGRSPSSFNRLSAVADDKGEFEFPAVPPGSHTLVTQRIGLAADRRTLEVPKEAYDLASINIELLSGRSVRGVVLDIADRPVPDLRVTSRHHRNYIDARTKTDAKGEFGLEGVPSTDLALEVYGESIVRQQVEVEDYVDARLTIRIERPGVIAGRVLDGASGEPLERFRVKLFSPTLEGDQKRAFGYGVEWASIGREFRGTGGYWSTQGEKLPAGSWTGVEFLSEGMASTRVDPALVGQEPEPDAFVVRLYPAEALEGLVVEGATGQPIPGAHVQLLSAGDRVAFGRDTGSFTEHPSTTTGPDGSFRFEEVGVGSTKLAVRHGGWAPAVDGPFEVVAGIAPPPRRIELHNGGAITGHATDRRGERLQDVAIRLFGTELGEGVPYVQYLAHPDEHGAFRFARLIPGQYQVSFWREDSGVTTSLWNAHVEVREDEVVEVDYGRTGDCSIRGTLISTVEIPSVLALDYLMRESQSWPDDGGRTESGGAIVRNGRFELHGLSPGYYSLSIHHSEREGRDFYFAGGQVELSAGEQATVQLELRLRE